jgi:hypothetical protein
LCQRSQVIELLVAADIQRAEPLEKAAEVFDGRVAEDLASAVLVGARLDSACRPRLNPAYLGRRALISGQDKRAGRAGCATRGLSVGWSASSTAMTKRRDGPGRSSRKTMPGSGDPSRQPFEPTGDLDSTPWCGSFAPWPE